MTSTCFPYNSLKDCLAVWKVLPVAAAPTSAVEDDEQQQFDQSPGEITCYEWFRWHFFVGGNDVKSIYKLQKQLQEMKRSQEGEAERIRDAITSLKTQMQARDTEYKNIRVKIAGKYSRQCPGAMDWMFGTDVRSRSISIASTATFNSKGNTPAATRDQSLASNAHNIDTDTDNEGNQQGNVRDATSARSKSPEPPKVTVRYLAGEFLSGW